MQDLLAKSIAISERNVEYLRRLHDTAQVQHARTTGTIAVEDGSQSRDYVKY
ncbi:MAG: hypothetical protein WD469_08990 [Paenibacillaceae bacterium]